MAAIVSDIKPRYHSFEDHLDRNLRLKPVVTLTTEEDLGTVFGGQYDIIRLCEFSVLLGAGGYRLYLWAADSTTKTQSHKEKFAIHFLWFRPRENTISSCKHLVL